MRNRIPTSEIAEEWKITPTRVLEIAKSRTTAKGELLIDKLSVKIAGMRWWVPSSKKRLKPRRVGRPSGGGK